MGSRHDRIEVYTKEDVLFLDLGDVEIWDGADLALLRDTLVAVIEEQQPEAVGIEMRAVKYIPSGFFGMLCDWSERGVRVEVTQPQPNVETMRWFSQFFQPQRNGHYLLVTDSHICEEVEEDDPLDCNGGRHLNAQAV